MKKLLLATHNPAKLTELKTGTALLTSKGIQVLSLDDLRITDDPEETGKTFEENARLKAAFYGALSKTAVIADDGGLTIDVLDGEPSVKSKRWMGRDGSDEELIAYTLMRLRGIPLQKRTASLQTTLCYYNPETKALFLETGKVEGFIASKPSSNPSRGYPYRALFIVGQFGKYYDELVPDEHKRINHRLRALSRLVKKINDDLVE